MNIFKKAAITLAATSMAVAPVVASAAPAAAFDGARATSTVEGQSELDNSTWLYGLLALAAIVGFVLLIDNDDNPASV